MIRNIARNLNYIWLILQFRVTHALIMPDVIAEAKVYSRNCKSAVFRGSWALSEKNSRLWFKDEEFHPPRTMWRYSMSFYRGHKGVRHLLKWRSITISLLWNTQTQNSKRHLCQPLYSRGLSSNYLVHHRRTLHSRNTNYVLRTFL